MKPLIKFFLEDETLEYLIKKSYGKVLHQNDRKVFLFEVESTDDLDHVEGDSLQNEFPEIVLTIEDFPVQCNEIDELLHLQLEIPTSSIEVEDEEGDMLEVFYTNLNLNDEEDLGTHHNFISFSKDDNNDICVLWKGKCEHFTNTDQQIDFEVYSKLNFKKESPAIFE